MELLVHALQLLIGNVRIHLRCRNRLVPEKGLHRSNIRTIAQKICRKGVTESVGRDSFSDPR